MIPINSSRIPNPTYNPPKAKDAKDAKDAKEAVKDAIQLEEDKNPLCMKEAIRLYQKKMLTGQTELTDKEKEEIANRINEYIDEYAPFKTEEDVFAFLDFIMQLHRLYGSKDDFFEFAALVTEDALIDRFGEEYASEIANRVRMLKHSAYMKNDKVMVHTHADSDEELNIMDTFLNAEMFNKMEVYKERFTAFPK